MYESSNSDESDHGERSRNVRKLLVRSGESQRDIDENYAYKRKLGDLIFDANFEGGNLGNVKQVDRYEYDLSVRPDVSNQRHSLWFNFTISNQKPNQCVILNFINLSEKLPLFSEACLTPVARSRLEPTWVRLQKNQVFYYQSTDHKYRLSIAFKFTFHDNEHQFALFYPYTLTTLDNFITRWLVHLKRCELNLLSLDRQRERPKCYSTMPDWSRSNFSLPERARSSTPSQASSRSKTLRDLGTLSSTFESINAIAKFEVNVIAKSALSKPIYELTVSSRSTKCSDRSFVIIIGRQIGNLESVSSLVCQGFVDFMLGDDQIAKVAREHINLIAFPMLDPDSTWVGNAKTDLMGQLTIDSNIVDANQLLYENYRLAIEKINYICDSSQAGNSVVTIELRVNPNLIGSRVVGTNYPDCIRMEKHLQLPRLLSRFSDSFYLEKCEFVEPRHKSNNLIGSLELRCNNVENYRLEISPFGYHKRSLVDNQYEEYDQTKYLLLGKSIAYASMASLRCKDKEFPKSVREHLKTFQPK